MNPFDFQGQGSKVKVTRYTSNLLNMIKTEPFQLGPSNLVHILFMARGQTLLIFKVMGQRSRSRYTLLLNLVNMIQTEPFQPGQSDLVHILLMIREEKMTPIAFKIRGQRSMSHTIVLVKPCEHDTD